MSKFIDKLDKLSRGEFQPIGFKVMQPVSSKPKIQLVANVAQESAERLAESVSGADAGLLRISKLSSAAKALEKMSQALSDIPWGGWLQGSGLGEIKRITRAGCDFVVFPANNTPLALLQGDGEPGKILEVEASLDESLLRAANKLPIGAVLVTDAQGEVGPLTWYHSMLFRRFADLLVKPLLVSVSSGITAGELQALWEAGVDGVVVEVEVEQSQDRLKELRQVIDKLAFPSSRRREKAESLLSRTGRETGRAAAEEEEEEEE